MKQQTSAAMVMAFLLSSAQAGPLTPLTDNFQTEWQNGYGWTSVTRASEFKSTWVDVFGQTVANPDGSTTTPRIRAGRNLSDGSLGPNTSQSSKTDYFLGERVDAYAHLRPTVRGGSFPEPAGADGPVRVWAETNFLDQKVFADSMRLVSVNPGREVTRQDQKLISVGPPPVYGLEDPVTIKPRIENRHETGAYSHWADSWNFDKATVVTLKFKVHASTGEHLGANPGWTELANHMYAPNGDNFVVLNNTQIGPSGIEAFDARDTRTGRDLGAFLQVFDMTHLRGQTEYCDEYGDCFPVMDPTYCPEGFEMFNCGKPVAGAGFRRLRFAGADQALWESGANAEIEALLELSFDAEVGRDYTAISSFFAEAINGGWIDGSSTMSLLAINLSNDAILTSRLARELGVNLPITRSNAGPPGGGTVPEPNTLALLALAAGLLVQAQRFGTARRPGGHGKLGNGALG